MDYDAQHFSRCRWCMSPEACTHMGQWFPSHDKSLMRLSNACAVAAQECVDAALREDLVDTVMSA